MNEKHRELLRTVITSTIKQDDATYKDAWKQYTQSKSQEITNKMLGITPIEQPSIEDIAAKVAGGE